MVERARPHLAAATRGHDAEPREGQCRPKLRWALSRLGTMHSSCKATLTVCVKSISLAGFTLIYGCTILTVPEFGPDILSTGQGTTLVVNLVVYCHVAGAISSYSCNRAAARREDKGANGFKR